MKELCKNLKVSWNGSAHVYTYKGKPLVHKTNATLTFDWSGFTPSDALCAVLECVAEDTGASLHFIKYRTSGIECTAPKKDYLGRESLGTFKGRLHLVKKSNGWWYQPEL